MSTVVRFFSDLPVRAKLATLVVASLAALAICLTVSIVNDRATTRTVDQQKTINAASTLVLQIDQKATELKSMGQQSVIRENPAEQQESLKAEIAATNNLVAELEKIELPAGLSDAVTRVKSVTADYTVTLERFVAGAAADREGARAAWEQVGVDNYLIAAVLDNERSLFIDTVNQAQKAADQSRSNAQYVLWLVIVLAAVIICVLAQLVVVSITRPLLRVRGALQAMAGGDLTVAAGVHSRDEVGQMARALNEAQSNMRSVVASVTASAHSVAAAAEQLTSTSGTMMSSAEQAAQQAQGVSQAATSVSDNVRTVAQGTEEMGGSIREISHNATEAARVAARAVEVADATTAQIGKLGESSTEIATVIKVITSIAEQTNLLALNATIEAARAGESGKGFAVVAGEVKELAQETARATDDISQRVQAIQTDTAGAVTAIGEITSVIASINGFQATIAGAVEEQTATTEEISRSVALAASGANRIADNITGLAHATQVSTEGIKDSQGAVAELSKMAQELQSMVSHFRT
ncbi:methyl-accepting chemotaxis protein [Nucisporomicrobium flavum]|uniref:methyl-accepting chemotaxis protein n=1 Tax=Nucisporomicrobium flavum TaxID=2785915 RepID=UPI0018F27BA0|nr:methyl-accepting chemotaxis protein [Nucisporomicrobium flavum]